MKRNVIIICIISGVVVGAGWWFIFNSHRSISMGGFETQKLTRGPVERTITSSGTLNPVGSVEVGTQVSGTVAKVYVDFNDTVNKNQIIAELDKTFLSSALEEARASLSRARALFEQAKAEYERSKPLFEKKFLSEQEFAKVHTDYLSQKASLELAEASVNKARVNLGYATIRSPISGMVISRNVEVGQTVSASLSSPTLFIIAENLRNMEILASVDESDIGTIRTAQDVRFSVQAHSDRSFSGKVNQIRLQPEVVQNVVTYTVVVSAENQEGLLLPGMTATVDFIEKRVENALLVPSAALRFTPPESMVAEVKKTRENGSDSMPAGRRGQVRPGATRADERSSRAGGVGGTNRKRESRGVVWLLSGDGSIESAFVQLGVSDGSVTEIIASRNERIDEGVEVITGMKAVAGKKAKKSVSLLPQPQQRFRGR